MKNLRAEALIIAAGIIVAGLFIFWGFNTFSERDRSVNVRGFSERIVEADKATWPIGYKAFGDDLSTLYEKAEDAKSKICSFLTNAGIPKADITVAAPKVIDYTTMDYKPENIRSRYAIQMTVTVASNKVSLVRELTYRVPDLMKKGISIVSDEYGNGVQYAYDALDKVKPAMIEASTQNARQAAEKFAKDSGSSIGKIKNASQGFFSIENRDENTPWMKKVRVVTSVSYYLKN